MTHFLPYITMAAFFLIIDGIWLGLIAKDFFQDNLSHLMMENVNIAIASIFYIFYAIGIYIFAVLPAAKDGNWVHALSLGALFGMFCYATYDITNLAILKDWPIKIVIVDVVWGTTLTGLTALVGYFVTQIK